MSGGGGEEHSFTLLFSQKYNDQVSALSDNFGPPQSKPGFTKTYDYFYNVEMWKDPQI